MTTLRLIEYIKTTFTTADRVYGSTFVIATGLHRVHVIIETRFVLII